MRKADELFSLTAEKAILYNFPQLTHVRESVIIVKQWIWCVKLSNPSEWTAKTEKYIQQLSPRTGWCFEELYCFIVTMRVMGKHKPKEQFLPFQKGFLMFINSLRGLFIDLKSENYTYLMASRCNQGILESYFSHIRGLRILWLSLGYYCNTKN